MAGLGLRKGEELSGQFPRVLDSYIGAKCEQLRRERFPAALAGVSNETAAQIRAARQETNPSEKA